MPQKPTAVIIGAGFTGCALAYDLALRGFTVKVLERGDICSGTSGRTHGLLHSGARYCVNDPEAGRECVEENIILRKIAKQCIEYNKGIFLALTDEEMSFSNKFKNGAEECAIPIRWMEKDEIIRRVPMIHPDVLGGFEVPDGAFDPLRLALAFAASAKTRGAEFLPFQQVEAIHINGNSCVDFITVFDRHTGLKTDLGADIFINATGAWAGIVAKMAGIDVPVIPAPGVMVAFEQRMSDLVLNRLNYPGDGDIIIPQRRMSVIGTTSFEVENADFIPVDPDQVKKMIERAVEMIPALKGVKVRGSYMSARPLISTGKDTRSLSRTFKCFDHEAAQGLRGFITISGGKATTCRIMAEKTADLACSKFHMDVPCQTAEFELDSYRTYYHQKVQS